MTADLVLCQPIQNHVLVVTLNRPAKMNAFNRDLIMSLREQLDKLAKDTSLRAVIFTGAGNKAFSSGADLKERKGMTLEETRQLVDMTAQAMFRVEQLPMPTIAAIH